MNRLSLPEKTLSPREVVAELDKFIVGQNDAKKAVAIALRNRWRRRSVTGPLRDEIMPNNIILIGPTGVGKTEIARRLAKLAGAPFIKVEATKFTEVGYVGRDVESMVRDLTDACVAQVRARKIEEVKSLADDLALLRILDILIPPPPKKHANGEPTEEQKAEEARFDRTRTKFLTKLKKGELDERIIEIETQGSDGLPMMQVMGPMAMDDLGINLQDILGPMMPQKSKKRKLSVAQAREALSAEESEKIVDQEAAVREAVERVENYGIIFIDEIDKIAGVGGRGSGPDVSREGVQRDLLPIVEGTNVMTKHGRVSTDHVLFIASGAFHVSKPSDLIPELQGRFPIRVELQSLTEADFIKILTFPENALVKQYTAILAADGVTLEFTEEGIAEIARVAARVNEQIENIGARRLHTVLTTLLEDVLFDAPDNLADAHVVVTKERVNERLASIVRDQDLSRYIL